ncbi:hypothetical protein OSB04_027812 [Centaurea solstitialis]|uniref:Protein kinase domain-containing protein n=1 Tax=Centaurea solstitialis TaxID=347529 RepID=A0AA38SSU4_9ASTR|nr:hypothetical protein OSB04_027812 [Centaurea solstitialis]
MQRAKNKRRRKRFFERNGGLLLKQEVAGNEGLVDKTRIFTSSELEKATDYFNENRIIGRGGQGTVYKGMLTDGRIVAVKKPKAVDGSQLEQFINEVVILSQVNHRNVVKLLGCCLETKVPLLVSEFIPNGTLYEHIHDQTGEVVISWNMRLQIATEVAEALSYLHSATSIPIYHRDIKSTNILLDDKYTAKISDFGASRFVSIGQTHLTPLVQGTFGYLDLEYFQSNQFTEKSDVYSFGVVLLELLTRERPVSQTRFGGNKSLVTHFVWKEQTNDERSSLRVGRGRGTLPEAGPLREDQLGPKGHISLALYPEEHGDVKKERTSSKQWEEGGPATSSTTEGGRAMNQEQGVGVMIKTLIAHFGKRKSGRGEI